MGVSNEHALHREHERLKALLEKHGIDWRSETPEVHRPESSESTCSVKSATSIPEASVPALSPEEKVALFRGLFQGRPDVFAQRWESSHGKSGYAPACANEWVEGVRRKPKIKCMDILRFSHRSQLSSAARHRYDQSDPRHEALPRGCREELSNLLSLNRIAEEQKDERSQGQSIEASFIGTLGGGKKKPKGLVDIALMQTLARREDLSGFLAAYGQIIVDECHHVSALSFENILKHAPNLWVFGLTATPIRRDGLDPIIFMQCAPIRHSVVKTQDQPDTMEVRARRTQDNCPYRAKRSSG